LTDENDDVEVFLVNFIGIMILYSTPAC